MKTTRSAPGTLTRLLRRSLVPLVLALTLAGCASDRLHRDGIALIDEGRYDEGLAALNRAVEDNPREPRFRATLSHQKDRIIASQLARGDRARLNGDQAAADGAYRQVLRIEPRNARATEALRLMEQQKNLGEMGKLAQAALKRGDVELADKHVTAMLALDGRHEEALQIRKEVDLIRLRAATPYPQLRTKFAKPISLEFRDANIKVIFDVLARTTGLNFILDKDVKPDLKATIFVKQVAVEDAVDLLLTQSQLEKKVVNDNTIIIYANTPAKLKEYQDLAIRSFYLANTDAKQAQALIKAMLKTKDVFIDEKLNTLTMRDTPDAIRLAEKLLQAQDHAEPEVILEIEVLEISRSRVLDLGISWPNVFTALNPAGDAITLLNELKGINSSRIGINGGPVANINAKDTDVNTLANPVIRVRNKEKAKIHIGDKIPIVSTTSTPSTQGPVTTESITYLDTGLKIEVEPTVYLHDEVGMKITLEVSNSTPVGTGFTDRGSSLVSVQTRNAVTSLRLKDGETQVLAGLLRNDLNSGGDKIPGLGDIPGVGRLFGSNKDTFSKTELILSIKPRIVRNLPSMTPQQMEYASGTEASLRAGGQLLRTGSDAEPVTLSAPAAAANVMPARTAPAPKPAADATPVASPLTLSWSGEAQLKAGEETVLTLDLKADQPVISTAIQIGYDPAALKVLEATEGDLMRQGATTTFSSRMDEKAGRLFIGLSRSGTTGATGEGSLVRLRLQGVAEKDKAPVRVVVFSGVGPGNKLMAAPLPSPIDLTVAP